MPEKHLLKHLIQLTFLAEAPRIKQLQERLLSCTKRVEGRMLLEGKIDDDLSSRASMEADLPRQEYEAIWYFNLIQQTASCGKGSTLATR